jgi:hypothetical protein
MWFFVDYPVRIILSLFFFSMLTILIINGGFVLYSFFTAPTEDFVSGVGVTCYASGASHVGDCLVSSANTGFGSSVLFFGFVSLVVICGVFLPSLLSPAVEQILDQITLNVDKVLVHNFTVDQLANGSFEGDVRLIEFYKSVYTSLVNFNNHILVVNSKSILPDIYDPSVHVLYSEVGAALDIFANSIIGV